MIKIFHNPRCQKSRTALAHIEATGEEIEIVEYLKHPPSVKELKEVLELLKAKPIDIVRKKEPLYIEMYKDKKMSDTEWLKVLSENPILIERPILIRKNKAAVARDEAALNNFI